MNKLYAIFIAGRRTDESSYYYKRHKRVKCPKACQVIIDQLLGGIDDSRMQFIATVVCELVLHTSFRTQILELDPVNTYTPIVHANTADDLLYDVVTPPDIRESVLSLLDTDIKERLQLATWPEFMAGVALHILRRI